MSICANGFPSAHDPNGFIKPDGTLKPDVASGYYSKYVRGVNYGKVIQPLSVRDLYSYACAYSSGNTDFNYVQTFCGNLLDAGGNVITNPPAVCGGTGPDILNYNPVQAALNQVQDDAAALLDTYSNPDRVKNILLFGVLAFILIILIFWICN